MTCRALCSTRAQVRNFYVGKDFKGDPPLHIKIAAGLTTGAVGIMIASPTDLVKVWVGAGVDGGRGAGGSCGEAHRGGAALAVVVVVHRKQVRMQSEGKLPPGVPKKYPSATAAYGIIVRCERASARPATASVLHVVRLTAGPCALGVRVRRREEGVAGLWKGVGPNIMRNALINAAELASYDQVWGRGGVQGGTRCASKPGLADCGGDGRHVECGVRPPASCRSRSRCWPRAFSRTTW